MASPSLSCLPARADPTRTNDVVNNPTRVVLVREVALRLGTGRPLKCFDA